MPYLRAPRLIFFVLTQLLCGATGGLAIWGLVSGFHEKSAARDQLGPNAQLDIMDAFAVGGTMAGVSTLASLLCSFLFNYELYFRHRPETLKTLKAKKIAFGSIILMFLASLIAITVVVARNQAKLTAGTLPQGFILAALAAQGKSLLYRKNTPLLAQTIVGWFAFASTCVTWFLVHLEANHVLKYGNDDKLLETHPHHANHDSALVAEKDGHVASTTHSEQAHHSSRRV